MRLSAGQLLLSAIFIALLLSMMPFAHAFDGSVDTNTGQTSSAVNTQQLQSLLTQLNQTNASQLANNSQFQQLLSQFNSSLSSGNQNLTASDLAQLQNFLSTQNSTSTLSSLIQSLKPSGNGVTVDPSTLSSLLNLANGSSTGVNSGNASQQVKDLTSLANLVKNVNPQLASQLLNSASNLSFKYGLSNPTVPLNPFSSLGSLKSPSPGSPSLGAPGLPNLELLLVPVIIIAVCLTLFAFRGRLAGLMSGQRMPSSFEDQPEKIEYDPNDPKKRIRYYFAKTVQFMKGKGFAKSPSETHREFKTKCQTFSGSEHVSNISSLYEKARFSGSVVTKEDADSAEEALSILDGTKGSKSN